MFSFNVDILNYKLQSFAQSKLLQMIDPKDLEKIKTKDEHPYFQAYTLCHEGISTPRLIGEKTRPIEWTKKAIQSLKNIITKGVKFFKGHNADNSTNNRRVLGEIVADGQEIINDKLHHIVVGYFPPETREEVKSYDVNSQEGTWNFLENAGNLFADNIEKLTGVALGESAKEQPAFAEARKLGFVQAFETTLEKNITGDVKMTFEDVKKAVKDLNIFPRQLFTNEDMKNDREFGKIFDENETFKNQLDEEKKKREDLDNQNKELLRKGQLVDAKDRLSSFSKELQLTDKQSKFIDSRFNDNLDDLSDEGLRNFLQAQLTTFKEVAGYFEPNNDVNQQTDVDPSDMTKAANNPLLEEDLI